MNKRLKAILLAALAALTIVICSGCDNKKTNEVGGKEKIVRTITMDAYEHTLSVPVREQNTNRNIQYEYHPGYEAVGISSAGFGKFAFTYSGGSIVYVNNEPVICKIDGSKCLDFGTPENKKETNFEQTEDYKVFDIGEHIISVPTSENNTGYIVEYPYHDGYKVVGASSSAYGQFFASNGGGAILYVNVVPVKCRTTKNGYTEFGTPIKEATLELTKEN